MSDLAGVQGLLEIVGVLVTAFLAVGGAATVLKAKNKTGMEAAYKTAYDELKALHEDSKARASELLAESERRAQEQLAESERRSQARLDALTVEVQALRQRVDLMTPEFAHVIAAAVGPLVVQIVTDGVGHAVPKAVQEGVQKGVAHVLEEMYADHEAEVIAIQPPRKRPPRPRKADPDA